MTGEQLDEKTIFNVARGIDSPQARAEYLDQACRGDGNLVKRVEKLLRGYEEQASFLESPAADLTPATDFSPVPERPGAIIGFYKLLQQIGEGGFGVVFLAEQNRPVKRRVALKILKPGMDTREVIARFEAERQALALMEHPNIAKVFDAGTTENGRPYFVMELVQGVPITEYSDQCNLTTRERLELFLSVCGAVQHAHQKGIIHRDIKPTNVLVAIQDGLPTPKIIDFGIAKATEQRLTEHTLMTAFAQMIGSPLYMSPEQAELSPLGVDTRSDIYSLGVLIYELLAGSTPFDKDRLHAASYDELRRIIREEEPPRPSTRISTLAADLATTVAERRRTDTRRLSQQVRGELDWIVMKCLEKDRNRRYESAGSLARDVERYLTDEPVQACPPSNTYRFRKFARRNKSLLAAAGSIAAALFIGLGLATWMYVRASTESAKSLAVSNVLQGMLRSANPDEAKDAQYTVRQLLDDFSESFDLGMPNQPEVEAQIRATIGSAYWRLGVTDKSEPQLMRALELRRKLVGDEHESVAETLVDLAWCRNEQGRRPDAEEAAREALQIYRDCGTAGSQLLEASVVLQRALLSQGKLDEAEAVTKQALEWAGNDAARYPEVAVLLHGQADLLIERGEFSAAARAGRRAVELHRQLHGPFHPETAWGLFSVGIALQGQREYEKAEEAFREALAIFRQLYGGDHHSVASALNRLKGLLQMRGDHDGFLAIVELEAELDRLADNPAKHLRLAGLLLKNSPTSDQKQEARRLIRAAMQEYSRVVGDHPADLERRGRALEGYVLAIRHSAMAPGLDGEVDELNARLATEIPKLAADFPLSNNGYYWAALLYRAWADELRELAAHRRLAESQLNKAIAIAKERFLSDPKRTLVWIELAYMYGLRGDVRWSLGKLQGAEADFRRMSEIHDRHAAEIASDALPRTALQVAANDLRAALYWAATGRNEQAAQLLKNAVANAKQITSPNDAVAMHWVISQLQLQIGDEEGYRASCEASARVPVTELDELAKARQILGWVLAPNALKDFSLAVARAEEFAANNSLGQAHFGPFLLGAALYRDGQYDRAAERLEASIAMYPAAAQPGYDLINSQRLLLAMVKSQQGHREEARRDLSDALPAVDEQIQTRSTSYPRAIAAILRREAVAIVGDMHGDGLPSNDDAGPTADVNPDP